MTRQRLRALGAASTLLLLVLSGCSSDGKGADDSRSVPADPPTTRAQLSDTEMTQAVEVRPNDLPREFGSKNLFGDRGDAVDGTVSLDVCGADYPSENLRTARHQVAYAASEEWSVSTESVAYESGGADQAMDELRRAIADCPSGYVDSAVAGVPDLKLRYEAMRLAPDWQEGALALKVDLTPKGQPRVSGVVIYQTRGDVLAGAYVWAGGPESPMAGPRELRRLATRVASLLSKRLEDVSPEASAAS